MSYSEMHLLQGVKDKWSPSSIFQSSLLNFCFIVLVFQCLWSFIQNGYVRTNVQNFGWFNRSCISSFQVYYFAFGHYITMYTWLVYLHKDKMHISNRVLYQYFFSLFFPNSWVQFFKVNFLYSSVTSKFLPELLRIQGQSSNTSKILI